MRLGSCNFFFPGTRNTVRASRLLLTRGYWLSTPLGLGKMGFAYHNLLAPLCVLSVLCAIINLQSASYLSMIGYAAQWAVAFHL